MIRVATMALAVTFTVTAFTQAHATDSLRLLSRVAHIQAQQAAEDLERTRTANVRSQAEKRLEQQRKGLTKNWSG